MKCIECQDYEKCWKEGNLTIKRKSCQRAKTKYVMTRADRIRSMGDEELAVKISHQTISSVCDIVCGRDCKAFATLNKTSRQRCVEIVLDWLQQPEEEVTP